MRRTTIGSRWSTPRRQYSGTWPQNPWINVASSSSQAGREAAANATAIVVTESAADRERAAPSHSTIPLHDDGTKDRQQKAAIKAWEDEGGSIRTDGNVRR